MCVWGGRILAGVCRLKHKKTGKKEQLRDTKNGGERERERERNWKKDKKMIREQKKIPGRIWTSNHWPTSPSLPWKTPCRRGPGQPVPLVTNQPLTEPTRIQAQLSVAAEETLGLDSCWFRGVASGRVRGEWQSERKSCPGTGTLGQCSAHWATGTSTADWALNQHLYMYNPQSSSMWFSQVN